MMESLACVVILTWMLKLTLTLTRTLPLTLTLTPVHAPLVLTLALMLTLGLTPTPTRLSGPHGRCCCGKWQAVWHACPDPCPHLYPRLPGDRFQLTPDGRSASG